jgi:hypothetical protein
MKMLLKTQTAIIFIGIILIVSCKKKLDGHTNATPVNWMSGQEFIFNDLKWQVANDSGTDEIFIITDNRPDLFFSNAAKQVFLKLDTSSVWIEIPTASNTLPASTTFYYDISTYNSNAFLYVDQNPPLNYHLVGRPASIRVKYQ